MTEAEGGPAGGAKKAKKMPMTKATGTAASPQAGKEI